MLGLVGLGSGLRLVIGYRC